MGDSVCRHTFDMQHTVLISKLNIGTNILTPYILRRFVQPSVPRTATTVHNVQVHPIIVKSHKKHINSVGSDTIQQHYIMSSEGQLKTRRSNRLANASAMQSTPGSPTLLQRLLGLDQPVEINPEIDLSWNDRKNNHFEMYFHELGVLEEKLEEVPQTSSAHSRLKKRRYDVMNAIRKVRERYTHRVRATMYPKLFPGETFLCGLFNPDFF